MAIIQSIVAITVVLLCSGAAMLTFADSDDGSVRDTSQVDQRRDSWIMDIRALVKRQSDDAAETGIVMSTPLSPAEDQQTTTTKKPKKKKKNKNKKTKRRRKKTTTTPYMTTLMTSQNWFQTTLGDAQALEVDQPLGENITLNAYDETTVLFEGHNGTVEFNLTNLMAPVIMKFESGSKRTFIIQSDDIVTFDPNDPSHNGTVVVTLEGRLLGVSEITVYVTDMNGDDVFETPMTFVVKTRRVPRLIDAIFNFILLPLILITTAGMGCKMDFIVIRDKLRKPFPILVGPICQFICQPFYAFSISKILKLSGLTAVGLVTVGSCPGGGVSNMITLLLDADLIMSVTMTFTSTCLAVAMLPINMLIYARHFLSGSDGVNIPFGNIMIQIMMLTVPILLGMLVHYKLPKVANVAIKSLNVLSLSMVTITLVIGIYSNLYIFNSEWQVLLGAFLLPSCGYTTGFLVSRFLARLPMESALTVMVETGVQNNLIAISMIKLSYPLPEADLMARMPIFVAISSIIIGMCMVGISIPINRKRRADRKQKAEEMQEVDDRYDRYEYEPVVRNGSAKSKVNGHTSPIEIPPCYDETEPFVTSEKVGKETIV